MNSVIACRVSRAEIALLTVDCVRFSSAAAHSPRRRQSPAHVLTGDYGRVIFAIGASRTQARAARFTADTTARSEAVVIDVAMPTPHTVLPPTEAST